PLSRAAICAAAQRSVGSRRSACRAMSRKGCRSELGTMGSALTSKGRAGAACVSASTRVTPRDQTSEEGGEGLGGGEAKSGGVISVRFAEGLTRLSDWTDGVGRKLELIADSKEIGRLDVGVNIELGVEIGENVDNGIEHIACFIGSEGALRKNLPQIFFSAFHDNVQKVHALQAAAAPVKEEQKIT